MADNTGGGGRIFVNGEDLSETIDRVSGGGPKYHPQTLEQARERLTPQLAEIRQQIEQIPAELRAERVVIETEVWANYLAISYFPGSFANHLQVQPLGSRIVKDGTLSQRSTGETPSVSKSFLFSVDVKAVDDMVTLLAGTASGRSKRGAEEDVAKFTNISLAVPDLRKPADASHGPDLLPFEAVLHPDPDESTLVERVPASAATLEKFATLIHSVGGRVHAEWNDVVDGLTFAAIDIPTSAVGQVIAFNPLRSLTPTPRIELSTAPDDTEGAGSLSDAAADPGNALPHVLVFDGGVDTSAGVFHNQVDYVDLTGGGLRSGSPSHGAAVTASVLFGQLEPGQPLPPAAAKVTHFQVVKSPDSDATEYPWILRQIRAMVEQHRPPLVNLSLGPRVPIEDREPHRWTAILDKLAHEHGTLFITAAGNDGEKDQASGLNRVQVPGDMVNGLCVGAFTITGDSWEVAPYSGRGPGRPGARIQPTVVAFGGDQLHPRFPRLRPNGTFAEDDHGTSYAAPLVTNLAARLSTELGGRADAPTLRALIAHSAERLESHDVLDVGFGRVPADVADILECGPDQVKLIYRGLIARDEVRNFPLPYPTAAASGMYDLSWTVAFTTGTDTAEAGDYTNAGLETTFRPHSSRFTFTKEKKQRHLNVATDATEVAELLADGWRMATRPDTYSAPSTYAPEAVLRDHGKWESISRWTCAKRRSSLQDPAIEISHVTREGGRLTSDTGEIEFSLVVTITSRAGNPIYALAQAEFDAIVPLPVHVDANVEVDTEVNVEI